MTKKQLLKLQLKAIRFTIQDRFSDLVNLAIPIFITSGLIVACFKFWMAVFP